ncbi:MAG: TerB family tellurite resistance protein [Rubrivivax sp.]|nr:TerB family tellurite resistance protein [Rubrivivax sp.]
MRTYPLNSPQAAARILALTLLSDGHVSQHELDLLDRQGAADALGIGRDELRGVIHTFCEDLLVSAPVCWADACQVDPQTMAWLFAEVTDPALRRSLLRLCVALAESDDHVADGESVVLNAIVEHWGLQAELMQPVL